MVTSVSLHDAMCIFLENEVANRYENKLKTVDIEGNESFTKPQVVRSGFLLPKSIGTEGSKEEEFPFILPRLRRMENVRNARERIVTLEVLFGVYDPGVYEDGKLVEDGSGYRDLWNLIESTCQAFFSHMIVDKKYSIIEDFLEAEMFSEQVFPYWEGYCRTRWHVAYPLPHPEPAFF